MFVTDAQSNEYQLKITFCRNINLNHFIISNKATSSTNVTFATENLQIHFIFKDKTIKSITTITHFK